MSYSSERFPWCGSYQLAHQAARPSAEDAEATTGNTGVGAALLGLAAVAPNEDCWTLAKLLETLVYYELRRQASRHDDAIGFHRFRDKNGYEVDALLMQDGRRVADVGVKPTATVTAAEFLGVRKLASAAWRRFAAGVVLYDGKTSASSGRQLYASPIAAMREV